MPKKRKEKPTNSELRFNQLTWAGRMLAKRLRNRATPYEKQLYKLLKDIHLNFKFQYPVVCANKYLYILDFYFPELNLCIELNSQKYHGSKEQIKKDNLRKRRLKREGISMIILWNKQLNFLTPQHLKQIIELQSLPYKS